MSRRILLSGKMVSILYGIVNGMYVIFHGLLWSGKQKGVGVTQNSLIAMMLNGCQVIQANMLGHLATLFGSMMGRMVEQ